MLKKILNPIFLYYLNKKEKIYYLKNKIVLSNFKLKKYINLVRNRIIVRINIF